ncbi:MAG: nucleotidyltransferase family protein, partial [Chlamydiia bacterium]|nr:nucleotidyltransferase family protein [Chlamydiia bacterium]
RNSHFFDSESFLVAHADNLTIFDLKEFINAHRCRPKGVEITMMTYTTDTPQSCGIVEVNAAGLVVGFYEKIKDPPSNLANAAVYIFEPSVVRFLRDLKMVKIDVSTQVLPFFLKKMQIFHNSQYHRDIGSLESLIKAQEDFPK